MKKLFSVASACPPLLKERRRGLCGEQAFLRGVLNNSEEEGVMKKVIHTDKAPKAVGPYSQAVSTGNLLFTAGQVAIDPATGKLVEGGIREQTRRVMENLKAILAEAHTDFSKVVKSTVFLQNIKHFAEFNQVYGEYFPSAPPARSTFQVVALPLGAMVEIEVVALVG
jgi:2-iminobutanoate/2-iminopropanoate deaminase